MSKPGLALIAIGLALLGSVKSPGQALTMDGSSGGFVAPLASVVPSQPKKWNHPTLSFHMVDGGPVAGDYLNVSVEEGYGNWLEVGYTRGNHTDGGDPTYSPLFNFAGDNIFNAKARVLSENARGKSWVPAVAIGGVLRTNDPYVSQYFAHKSATNGDIYGVAQKLLTTKKRVSILLSGGVRGTNAEVYGYGGNATHWQARAFGVVAFPVPFRKVILTPTFEVDQEPHNLAYVPGATIPTTLVYAVRMSSAPDAKWSVEMGTGKVCNTILPEAHLKVNHAIAVAFDRRF